MGQSVQTGWNYTEVKPPEDVSDSVHFIGSHIGDNDNGGDHCPQQH